MTTRVKTFSLPRRPRRRRSTQAAPTVAPHSATSSTVAPQLLPLLDLLADLIAREVWRQRSGSHACLDREITEADAVSSDQGASTVVIEQPGNSAPFPSFPAKSHPECHQNPNNHPPADEPVRTKEKKS